MVMTSPRKKYDIDKLQLVMNFNIINITNETKFLVVIIDKHLTWKNHINYISNKVYKGLLESYTGQKIYFTSIVFIYFIKT